MAVRSEYSESKRTGVQTAHNLKVAGSNPAPATKLARKAKSLAGFLILGSGMKPARN